MLPARRYLTCLALIPAFLPLSRSAAEEDLASTCPSRDDVLAALDQLLVAKLDAKAAATVQVHDRGGNWEVQVGERKAAYADPGRNCAERVRVAAIFSALVLEPFGHEPAPAEAVSPPTPPPSEPRGRHTLEIAPQFIVVPNSAPNSGLQNTATSWGGSLRWAFSGARFGLTSGVSGATPFVLRFSRYEASLAKLSLDLSMRATLHAGRFGFGAEIGPYGAMIRVQGRGLAHNRTSWRFDGGGRLALRIDLQLGRMSLFLSAHAEWSTRRFTLVVDPGAGFVPSGEVGTAPRLWLGAMLGAAAGF